MATKTQPTQDIAQGDNAPDMGTLGADPTTGQKVNPATGQLSTADPGVNAATPGNAQQDINQILGPYVKELMNLGPEYQQEMDFLKPYLEGTPTTFSGLEQQSAADESPTGSKSVAAASSNVASAMEGEQAPGFGGEAEAAQQFEGTVPYSQILQSVLQAGKNEILGYSSVPNLTNINTSGWPSAISSIIPYLEKSIGYTGAGVPNPTTAGIQAQQNPGGYGSTNPNITNPTPTGSTQGGGNAG